MSRTPSKPVDGVLLFGRCLRKSQLESRERLVLGVGMLYHLNFKTWYGFMSQEQVASNCGLSVRSVQDSIGVMKRLGVLTVLKRGCGRSGKSSEYQLHLHALAGGRIPASAAGIPDEIPANGDLNTGKPRHEYRQTTTEIPAPFADPQCIQTHIQTTTTTTTGEVGASIPPAVPVGGGDGGGASLLAVGSEKTPSGGHCPQESERLLVDFGVSKRKATALAAVYPPPVVEAGIAWVKTHAPDATSPAGRLVSILEDGTAEEHFHTLERERLRREAEERERARVGSVARLLSELFIRVEAGLETQQDRSTFADGKARIAQIWANGVAIAMAGAVSEADLLDPSAEPREIFDRIVHAAEAAKLKATGGAS